MISVQVAVDGFDFILVSAPTLEKKAGFDELNEQTVQFIESLKTGNWPRIIINYYSLKS